MTSECRPFIIRASPDAEISSSSFVFALLHTLRVSDLNYKTPLGHLLAISRALACIIRARIHEKKNFLFRPEICGIFLWPLIPIQCFARMRDGVCSDVENAIRCEPLRRYLPKTCHGRAQNVPRTCNVRLYVSEPRRHHASSSLFGADSPKATGSVPWPPWRDGRAAEGAPLLRPREF